MRSWLQQGRTLRRRPPRHCHIWPTLTIQTHGNAKKIDGTTTSPESPINANLPVRFPTADPTIQSTSNAPLASATNAASVSITSTVEQRNESADTAFTIAGSSLSIGDNTYTIVNGTGIFNQAKPHRCPLCDCHLRRSFDRLIMIRHTDHVLSGAGSSDVTLSSPQSKLTSQFFLSLKGTLTFAKRRFAKKTSFFLSTVTLRSWIAS